MLISWKEMVKELAEHLLCWQDFKASSNSGMVFRKEFCLRSISDFDFFFSFVQERI